MKTDSDKVQYNKEADFIDGRFFALEEAMEAVTYSQDKSLLMIAYQRYKELI